MKLTIEIKYRRDLGKLLDYFILPRKAAEVGVAEGRFSLEMHKWDLDELYLVDIWENVPFIEGCGSFEQSWHDNNYNNVKEQFKDDKNVLIMKGFSHKMAQLIPDNSLGIVYLDGDHTYAGVKADIQVWWSKLVEGGIMGFHDYKNPTYGVMRAVTEHMGGEQNINILEEDGKIENIGAWVKK